MIGKRFIFSCVAVVCISATSIILKYPADVYLKLIGIIAGIYISGQSLTDRYGKRDGI